MKRLIIAPLAKNDLRSIAKEIAISNPRRARSYIAELRVKAQAAAANPQSFRTRKDIGPGLRSLVHGNYLILYREEEDAVRVVRFWHMKRDPKSLRFD